MDWEALFRSSSMRLRARFEEARVAVQHSGTKGHVNEKIVAEFMRGVLPSKVGFCAGEAIDSEGGRSRQVDVLAYDIANASSVFVQDDIQVLPVEAVYGALEVKAYLNKAEIEKAFLNMQSLKGLTKKAYFPNLASPRSRLYGRPGTHWPVTFFIFAFDSDSLESVFQHVARLNADQPQHMRIDMVFVLDKGMIVNVGTGGMDPIPTPGTNLIAKPSNNALLAFYAMMHTLLAQTYSEPVNMNAYLSKVQF